MRANDIKFGLIMALIGFAMLSVGDAVAKSMAGAWPGTAVSALRYTFGAVGLTIAVAVHHGRPGFAVPRPGLQVARAASVSMATVCFFMGVMAMPLADATAILFTSPMLTIILSAIFLGEKTKKAALGAIALAFAGVLVVLRPNLLELGLTALYPLGASLGMASLMVLNRKAAGVASVLSMQWLVSAFGVPFLLAAAVLLHLTGRPEFVVTMPSLAVIAKCACIACTATLAHMMIYSATVRVSAALVAPMTYVQLLMATGIGWMWFGDAPDAVSFGGAALIIAGGLWLWRTQRVPDLGGAPD